MSSLSTLKCRANRACRRCNSRRVKCNVVQTLPCDNCAKANVYCEVPESRRGKHPRNAASRVHINQQRSGNPRVESSPQGQGHPLPDDGRNGDQYPTLREQPRPHSPRSDPSSSTPERGRVVVSETFQPHKAQPDVGELFLGESATLRCVYDDQKEIAKHPSPEENARLQFSLPKVLLSEAVVPEWESQRKERRIRYLQDDGVLDMPPNPVCEMLLGEYFRWLHPCFPVVDRTSLLQRHKSGGLSPLLSLSIFSLAAAYCDDEALADAGLESRQRARYLFYSRAKDLYEVDYETDKTTVIQALFLMSFWRSGRLLDKHTRHWLGIAITLAQSAAMHRCFPNMNPDLAKMRRRIWWSIYIREGQCSASLGLPNRISDNDCDIEPLQPVDLEESALTEPQLAQRILPPQMPEHISYIIEISKLTQLLANIIDAEYIPRRTMDPKTRQYLKEKLFQWDRQLPEHMSPRVRLGESLNLHAAMLHLAYNNALILLFRNSYIRNTAGETNIEGDIAVQAASRNSSVIEDLLSRSLVRYADIHLINSLFNTLSIHVVHIRRSKGTSRSVAEHRARLCLLALQELQKTWQVTVWLLQLRLFFQALDHATAQSLQLNSVDMFSPEESTIMSTNAQPPGPSALPELWDMYPLGSECGDRVQPSAMNLTSRGDLPGLFEWPLSMEGIEELLSNPTQISTDFTVPDLIG